ncbi:amidohydrolase family protein [Singulisphaera acidiphila]|uniref:Amidohydrolase, imidazolonepropionase n=1 Tax=Singulisphaera acidiphila (strain ATCC BAA-1392 / DSM 18658 / VKM B-2454 / MOB10) TaxID=886293 RepID=L0DLJ9_SINAD|nr:amidohydrolase family protein [Singulisphaera acidiphila]AGA29700.1 amidohydrolase, imidazolonepropionase [Singulisphaera acidiphila DSM 18658]
MTSAARIRLWVRISVLGTVATILAATPLISADDPIGYRPAATAIQGAKIVAGPDNNTIENGTIVVRDGRIDAVGPSDKIAIPLDAETIDGKGLVVYPGFIDLFTTIGQSPNTVRSRSGAGRSIDYKESALARTPEDNRNGLTPEFEVASAFSLSESQAAERRKLGFTDLLAAPAGAIATGQSALISTSGGPRREVIVRSPIALHINLRAPFEPAPANPDDDHAAPSIRLRSLGRYPSVLMGVVAHLRQAMLDAEHQHALKANPKAGTPRFLYDPALDALQAARTKTLPVWWEANSQDEIHRALDLAEEFGTTAVIVGGREASKVVDRLKALNVPVVLRLDFPDEPKVPSESDYRKRDLADRTEPYQALIARATRWKEQVDTAQVLAKAGVRFALASDGLAKAEHFPGQLRKLIAAGLSPETALDALTQGAAQIAGLDSLLGTLEPGKLGHLVVLSAPFGEDEAKVRYVLVDGAKFEVEKNSVSKKADPESKPATPRPEARGETPKPKAEEAKPKETAKAEATPKAATPPPAPKTIEDQPSQTPFLDVATEFDHNRKPKLETKGNVLIKDATILTIAKEGTIAKGSILVQNGKIAAVGPDLAAPEGVTVIDATGLVAMPGIIDSHSHIAIQGGSNEWSLSVVPEVRIKDVITGNDPAIYRALAGGTTTARILHGSADTIGGQDAVIKLKYRQPARDLILKDAPQGVKFALGENVTRNPGRFPNTRMGVEATIDRAFQEARVYQEQWKAFEAAKAADKSVLPPRRDLRLEALARVLDGSIKIHSHCYRSDEILMLMRVAARHGVRVQSLQHVLEGYKIAPEIAAHGATASTFSDWWAYKVEAFDAIPYNAALMAEAGVSVSIKSDSEELIRHLNLETAKMVKYGGATEGQALAMITINPARELGLQDRLGSIEVGKDADISLFNAHPLDAFARCELALIDGEVWFQRSEKNGKFALRPGDHKTMPTSSSEARARVLDIPRNPKEVYALVGASIHPISGPDIPNGTLVISEGKISAVGDAETMVPSSAQTINLQGLDIWPGMVDAGTRLGVFEVNSLPETQDDADSAQFEPELRTSTALHPDSEIIPVSRANGILSAYVQPSGGLIAGQGCVIQLNGWVPREMVIADPVALHVTIPRHVPPEIEGPGVARREGPDPIKKRAEQIELIVEEFHRALDYDKVLSDSKEKQAEAPAPDLRLAALVPYAKGRKPVIFHAEHRTEILDALKIAGTLKLKAIISGGADAWKVADALKTAKVPVLIGGTLRTPGEPSDPYDAPYANPARLHEAGVSFAIRSNPTGAQQATASRNLPYEAAIAVAFGLPEAEALKAVTLAPAQILGVAEQVGSLETGKRADLIITAGHLLQPTTEVKAIFLDGKPIDPESRHTILYEKYRRRLAEVRAGTAILGIDTPKTPAAPAPSVATPPATSVPSGQE